VLVIYTRLRSTHIQIQDLNDLGLFRQSTA